MLRGTTDYADCANCPFSRNGVAHEPVVSEYPEDPKWLIVGEGPGKQEVLNKRPFVGESGQVVNRMLAWIRRPREEVGILNATLCLPFRDATDHDKQRAGYACRGRLLHELRKFPGKPILALGGVSAKSIIPKATLEAIDPPEALPSYKKKQKDKQQAELDHAKRREKKLAILRQKLFKQKMKELGLKATKKYMEKLAEDTLRQMEASASEQAKKKLEELDQEALERRREKARRKGVGISDIASTHFFVDTGDASGPRSIIPTIHPAAMIRGGRRLAGCHSPDLAFWSLVADAGKIDALSRSNDVILKFDVQTEFQDADRAELLMKRVFNTAIEEGEFALDLETYVHDADRHHALQMYVAQIRAIGISTTKWGISVLWDQLPERSKRLLRILLSSWKIRKIFHNGLYDRTVLAALGFVIQGPWDDTMLAHHSAFPGASHRLQSVTAQFKAVEPWKSEFRNQEETPERLTLYNVRDTQATAVINKPLQVWIKRTKTDKVYHIDRTMAEMASRMHLDGVPMSREVNQQLFTQFSATIAASREVVERIADEPETREQIWKWLAMEQAKKARKADPEMLVERTAVRLEELKKLHAKGKWKWKVSAPQHIGALLRSMGVELTQTTKTGATKVDKETLESMIEVDVVRDVIRFRENDKRLMTFIWPIFDRTLKSGRTTFGFADQNSRVHPIWSIHKITGRWASTDPVCSNYPKAKIKKHPDGRKEILIPDLRAQVVAPPGRIFVGFDFGQLEARIIAMVSGDPWLCKVFADGKDIHREAARLIFKGFDNLDKDEQKKFRDLAKPFEYGAFYGADPETLYKNLIKQGYTLKREDVYRAHTTLMKGMSGVEHYQREVVLRAQQAPHEIRSFLYGRRRCFPLGEVDRNECLNYPIQSSAADIMNTGMERISWRLAKYKQAFPILQIHDAAVFECWEDDAESLMQDVIECFVQEYTLGSTTVKFPIDCKIGRSWADL